MDVVRARVQVRAQCGVGFSSLISVVSGLSCFPALPGPFILGSSYLISPQQLARGAQGARLAVLAWPAQTVFHFRKGEVLPAASLGLCAFFAHLRPD